MRGREKDKKDLHIPALTLSAVWKGDYTYAYLVAGGIILCLGIAAVFLRRR
jgi:hypothetical protein